MPQKSPVIVRPHLGGVRAEGPPSRHLLVPCQIENRSETPLVLISAWVDVSFIPGGLAATGPRLAQLHSKAQPAIVEPVHELNCQFSIPVTAELLNGIERERRDQGVQIVLKHRLLFAPVVSPPSPFGDSDRHSHIGLPWEVEMPDEKGRDALIVDIPQSEWLKLLSTWRWKEVELFELVMDVGRESPMFQRAFEHIRGAEERFRRQDFPGTLQECRLVFEAMGIDVAPQSDTKTGINVLVMTHVLGEKKQAAINDVLFELSQLCHLGRHEKGIQEVITRGEALFTLRATLAALQMIAGN